MSGVFKNTCGCALLVVGVTLVLPPTEAAGFEGRGNSENAPRCEVPVELVAVVYDHRKPERSFAMVVQGSDPARIVGVGSTVGAARVVAVLPKAIWLDAGDDLCWLPLAHESVSPPKARSRPKRNKTKRKTRKRSRRRR